MIGLFVFPILGIANDPCTSGAEFEPFLCPSPLTDVVKITVVKNGAAVDAAELPSGGCGSFQLNESTLRAYFLKAKVTTENDAHHTLDWSPCYASGQVEFRNGKKGAWRVHQFRVGEVSIDQGEKIILYCPDCKFSPFE